MIKEDYASFSLAKKLREKGFPQGNINHDRYYNEQGQIGYNHHPLNQLLFYCPTLSLVQKWLREEKGIIITIDFHFVEGKIKYIGHMFNRVQLEASYLRNTKDNTISKYDTYEDALETCIDKALDKQAMEENKL